MQNKSLALIVLITALVSGCITTHGKPKPQSANIRLLKVYNLDLDGDGIKEIVKVEDDSRKAGHEIIISIINKDRSARASFIVPGLFNRMEFVDLNGDSSQQIAVFYDDEQERINLSIYRLKGEQIYKVFTINSPCGIDTEFGVLLPRVKVGKPMYGEKKCSRDDIFEWEAWVWAGDRFIRQ